MCIVIARVIILNILSPFMLCFVALTLFFCWFIKEFFSGLKKKIIKKNLSASVIYVQ